MKVKCIRTRNLDYLTTGKEYPVISYTSETYEIINNKGLEARYSRSLFEPVQEPATMEVKLTLPEIEGFTYTGERRKPEIGEYFLDELNDPEVAKNDFETSEFIILKKIEPEYSVMTPGGLINNSTEPLSINAKFVEIKALKDIISIIDARCLNIADLPLYEKLSRLLD
tara:strand:- start:5947 stop:6453 length:507 start_codon:yes stop_codon:yes gene_type:complete